MDIKKIFAVPDMAVFPSAALLFMRFVAGLGFIFHGWGKIQSPFGWMGPDAPVPGIFQSLAAISEFGGGIAWILGLLTPLASFGLLCTMAVAVLYHVMQGDPFVSTGGGAYELAAVYFCFSLLLIAMGPGRFSLDRTIFGRRP